MEYTRLIYDVNNPASFERFVAASAWLTDNISNAPECTNHYDSDWSTHAHEYVNLKEMNLPWYWDYNRYAYSTKYSGFNDIITLYIRDDATVMVLKLLGLGCDSDTR